MNESVTKGDLNEFGLQLINKIHIIMQDKQSKKEELQPEWLKSKAVKKIMDMSPGSIQNLRITGKVRYKKILGSYYYNKSDLQKLFDDAHKG